MTTQTTLALVSRSSSSPAGNADCSEASFDLGRDHASHPLAPAPDSRSNTSAIGQGWRAARAVHRRRPLAADHGVRQWLTLRAQAGREGIAFDGQRVTPHCLSQLRVSCCPVLRIALSGLPGEPDTAVFERLNPLAAYGIGNIVMMSQAAARARAHLDLLETLRRARSAERSGETVERLDAGAWWRLASLLACATPLPFHDSARLPLALLPPTYVRPINPAHRLQCLVTLLFMAPGWSGRTRALAALLPQAVRHDFNLFVGALAPRVLEAGPDADQLRRALEDAWLQERVQRRWQHFALSLGEAATVTLLQQTSAEGPATGPIGTPLPAGFAMGRALIEGGRSNPPWRDQHRPSLSKVDAASARPAHG